MKSLILDVYPEVRVCESLIDGSGLFSVIIGKFARDVYLLLTCFAGVRGFGSYYDLPNS
jgi:hypothetical protein